MEPGIIAAIVGGSCVLVAVLLSGLRVIRDYQRGVILRLGRHGPTLDPGLRYILPLGIDRLTRVDLRSAPLDVPAHEVITHDGVPVVVGATVTLQVLNPLLAVTRVVDYRQATVQLVQAALRDVVAAIALRELLLDQEAMRGALAQFVDARAEPWGIRVTSVDLREVVLPDAMQRAMARQAGLRGGQTTVSAPSEPNADGRQLEAVAKILAAQPRDVQARFLQALSDARSGGSTVVVVPLPVDLVQPFVDLQGHAFPALLSPEGEMPGGDSPAAGQDQ